MRNKILIFLMLAIVSCFTFGCGKVNNAENKSSNPSVTSDLTAVTITPSSVSMEVGSTQQFSATGYYTDQSVFKSIAPNWELIGDVGSINSSGLFKAEKPGTGEVRAKLNGVVGKANIIIISSSEGNANPVGNTGPVASPAPAQQPSPGTITETDTTAPSAPQGLTVSASENYLDLSWDNHSETDLSGYNVYRGTLTDPKLNKLASLGKVNCYRDQDVFSGVTYIYAVTAFDSNSNESSYSNIVTSSLLVPKDVIPPAAPAGLNAQAGKTNVQLNWLANSESDLAGYNLYRSSGSSSGFARVNIGLIASSSYSDNSVNSDTQYQYKLTAVDNEKNESGFSEIVSVKTLIPDEKIPPATPVNFSAKAGDFQVNLNWDLGTESDLLGYRIYKYCKDQNGNKIGFKYNGTSYSSGFSMQIEKQNYYSDAEVANGTTYYYQLSAIDTNGNESQLTPEISATPVSSIDDQTVIKNQLLAYEQGMWQEDINKIIPLISDNYSDQTKTQFGTFTTTKSTYIDNLKSTFDMYKINKYILAINEINIIDKTCQAKVKIEMVSEGQKTSTDDYTGYFISSIQYKTISFSREGIDWRIFRDKIDKTIGFMTVPWKYKQGYNMMAQAVILNFDNYNQFSNALKSVSANDPAGQPMSFSPGYLGQVAYFNAGQGDYSTAVNLEDNSSLQHNLVHNYKVYATAKSLSIQSKGAITETAAKIIKFVLAK